ncbi:peptidoglycan DD-metalloendopeptidase family protein [Streptacidiphilus melanogenes]|uniref:peptidoglycan DD-metalloendopeptidase family protein n=1 Tax=Streptacidiphilus melanogenes TaxID=411235 RepID=UPI000A57E400|nr:peptidoglycan DD-metalloendopeptidase family protein [Streptacidiphilus melanogenes]
MGMATLLRLRSAGRAPGTTDPVAQTLLALFGAPEVAPTLIGERLLERVPVHRLQEAVDALRERHGELRSVRRQKDLHLLVFATGAELVWARLDEDGRLASFVTGPGALTARLAARTGTVPVPRVAAETQPGGAPPGADPAVSAAPPVTSPEAAPVAAAEVASEPEVALASEAEVAFAEPPVPTPAPMPRPVRTAGPSAGPAGPKPAAVVRLQRTVLAYAAATAAELTFPWLPGGATGWLLILAQTPAFAWYVLRTAPTWALPPWFRSLPLAPAVVSVLAFGHVLGAGLAWGPPGLPEIGLFVGVTGLAAWTWQRSRPVSGAPTAHPLQLRSPLRGGVFVCTEAGGPAVNRYAEASLSPGGDRCARYAVDLVQLGEGPQWRGRRALGLAPATNERYAVFGHPVLSPVDGVVLAAVDGLPDRPPLASGTSHPDGNHVRIGTDRGVVVLSGLREDSVQVRRGQHVVAGTPLGSVGNSAAGPEPALRVRAESSVGLGLPFRLTEVRGDLQRGKRLAVGE